MTIFLTGHIKPDLDSITATITYAEFLKKIKRYENMVLVSVCSGKPNKETIHILEKFDIKIPPLLDDTEIEATDAFILVDHNEESQRHPKVTREQVIEIIDHHKINVNFTSPVRLDVKPFGATNSIIYELFDMYGIKPSDKTKKLMLAAILSDTVGLKSSTTTGFDSEAANKLAKETDLDIDKFTFEIFKAKSDITGLSPDEIVRKDFKIFDFSGKKVFINQLETVEPAKVLSQKEKLLETLEEIKSQENVGHAYLVITDILKINSKIMYTTDEEKEIVEKAFVTEDKDGIADIGPRMSRKKDIAPKIEEAMLKN
ncbi:manganese-dependent inorganic pyrophosphatase [Patescibacteria group bacterium]|nr:manganese-dependent inorganic pyrophosphatase [Patescibacteria group bacterium]